MTPPGFQSEQAVQLARAFEEEGVDYLFIGKGAAILLGFPFVTQDIDVFADRTPENGRSIVRALKKVGFALGSELENALITGNDFVQIKTDPFDLDVIFAPDGISSFAEAKSRAIVLEGFRIANLRDIIASKRASGREKDLLDLEYLERFRQEFERLHAPDLRTASQIALNRSQSKR
ncbi:MAG: hypothetical protein HYY23_16250 [Verrucomicrobia bacterium]|nr:hypothetical protein [Verrucomicrobiota bacterium]